MVSTSYDAVGNVASTIDANGHTISYQYDAVNHRTTEQFSDGSGVSYTYTSTGKIATVTDASGVTTSTYDGDDRLLSRTEPTHPTVITDGSCTIQVINYSSTNPVITSNPETRFALADGAYRYSVKALDADNDKLSYRLVNSPVGALINKDTGELL